MYNFVLNAFAAGHRFVVLVVSVGGGELHGWWGSGSCGSAVPFASGTTAHFWIASRVVLVFACVIEVWSGWMWKASGLVC